VPYLQVRNRTVEEATTPKVPAKQVLSAGQDVWLVPVSLDVDEGAILLDFHDRTLDCHGGMCPRRRVEVGKCAPSEHFPCVPLPYVHFNSGFAAIIPRHSLSCPSTLKSNI